MSRMEMWRKREGDSVDTWLGTDRKDFISLHRVIGFIAGSAFYAMVVFCAGALAMSVLFDNLSRSLILALLIGGGIGYLVFMFFYQRWYYNYSNSRYIDAKKQAIRWRSDWEILTRLYEEEEEASKPTVDMDLLFPEGSLGENE